MKSFFFFLSVFLICKTGSTQALFSKSFADSTRNFTPNKLLATADGGFLLSSWGDIGSDYLTMIKLNALGDTMWTSTLFPIRYTGTASVIELPDSGGYMVGGGYYNQSFWTGFLTRLDLNGNPMFSKCFTNDTSGYFWIEGLVCTPDDSLIIVCATSTTYFVVMKTDLNGNVAWVKRVPFMSDYPLTILQLQNRDIIISGGQASPSVGFWIMMSMDENGNLNWCNRLGGSVVKCPYATFLDTTSDGHILASVTVVDYDWFIPNYCYFAKISNNGNIIWRRTFSTYHCFGVSSAAISLPGNRYAIVIGNHRCLAEIHIAIADSMGTPLTVLRDTSTYLFWPSIVKTSSQQVAFVGSATNTQYNHNEARLFLADLNGSTNCNQIVDTMNLVMTSGAGTTHSITLTPDSVQVFYPVLSTRRGISYVHTNCSYMTALFQEKPETDVVLYPNPSTGVFSITSLYSTGDSELRIYDLAGKVVYSTRRTGNKEYQVETDLSPGIYFLSLKNTNTSILKKLIIQ